MALASAVVRGRALVRTGDGSFFVKRHHASVRSAASLAEEHAFLAHLHSHGAPVVRVLLDADGRSVHERGSWTYEVHTVGVGQDLYRDAISWSPFAEPSRTLVPPRTRALARLHAAASGFDAPHRGPAPLIAGFTVFADEDPIAAVERYAAARPHVAAELAERKRWRADLTRHHLPFHDRLRPHLTQLEPLWVHGKLGTSHASNLLWQGRPSRV